MTDKNEVFEIVKSLITSQKGGVLLKDINRDYMNLAGSRIPYKTFGYRSIEELLGDIPEIKSYMNDSGQLVFLNKGKNCEHLVKLVSKQKSTSTNKLKQSNPVSQQKTRKPRNSDVGAFKYERNKEKENYVKSLDRSGVGDWTDFKKREYTQSSIYEPKTGVHSRKSVGDCRPNPNVQRTKGWKPSGHIEESTHLEREEEDIYNPAVDDRTYLYKPSTSLQRRQSFHGFGEHKYRDFDRLRKCMDELQLNEDCGVPNDYYVSDSFYKGDKYASSQRPKSYRAGRCEHLMDIPNASYGDNGFSSPASGSHYKYPQSQKYRNNGGSKNAYEFGDWDIDCYDHMNGGRSMMDNSSRLDENDACGFTGRKINVISGSLRVTIQNS